MVNLAVIPARGGSKRIPQKNKRLLAGRPLVAWTIEAAMQSKKIDHVIVSTDDQEIYEIGLEMGALDVGLRKRFSDDHAPSSAVTIDSVQNFAMVKGGQPDFVFQLLPTCPLRGPEIIDQFWSDFMNLQEPRIAMSCASPLGLNPNWAIERNGDGSFIRLDPVRWGQRSQDLPSIYFPSGAIWCAETKELLAAGSFHSASSNFIEIPAVAAFDIDTLNEFKFAEIILKVSEGQQSGVTSPLFFRPDSNPKPSPV